MPDAGAPDPTAEVTVPNPTTNATPSDPMTGTTPIVEPAVSRPAAYADEDTHDFDRVMKTALRVFRLDPRGIHGRDHWLRVERIGLHVGARTGADLTVVRLFARLHDCMRVDDGWDPNHGVRAADFAATLRGSLIHLDDERFERLQFAIRHHNDGGVTDDPTIGACWDADRLELQRLGIEPDPELLSTSLARHPATIDWAASLR